MADQDYTTVRIGTKARGPGAGGVDRERVVKGKSAINAAQRSGAIIATEKKYASANTKSGTDGQLLAKIARDNDIIGLKHVGKEVGQAIIKRRNEMVPKMTQKGLADKVQSKASIIADIEKGDAAPDHQLLGKISSVLGISLKKPNIGKLKYPPKTDTK